MRTERVVVVVLGLLSSAPAQHVEQLLDCSDFARRFDGGAVGVRGDLALDRFVGIMHRLWENESCGTAGRDALRVLAEDDRPLRGTALAVGQVERLLRAETADVLDLQRQDVTRLRRLRLNRLSCKSMLPAARSRSTAHRSSQGEQRTARERPCRITRTSSHRPSWLS